MLNAGNPSASISGRLQPCAGTMTPSMSRNTNTGAKLYHYLSFSTSSSKDILLNRASCSFKNLTLALESQSSVANNTVIQSLTTVEDVVQAGTMPIGTFARCEATYRWWPSQIILSFTFISANLIPATIFLNILSIIGIHKVCCVGANSSLFFRIRSSIDSLETPFKIRMLYLSQKSNQQGKVTSFSLTRENQHE